MQENENDVLKSLSHEMRRLNKQTNEMAMYLKKQKEDQESEERTTLEEWQPIQTQYVSSYLEKCISRMNLHEESARYYNKRHYFIVIPATAMGVITSTAAFSQWSNNVLCGQTSWVMLLVGTLMALTTLLHNLSEFVFAYKDKARQHQQSYINFSRLVKRISNEYNNPIQEHKPYRQFIESISEDYDRYTEHALMVPSSVDKMLLGRWIKSNEIAKEKEKLLNEDSSSKEERINSENRIVQQSTINTAIDAATIHSTTAAMKTIAEKADEERINQAVEEYRKHKRSSPVVINDDIVQEFKIHNPLHKPKKGDEVLTDVSNNIVAAARYGTSSSNPDSRRQSINPDYTRRHSGVQSSNTENRRPSLIELMQKRHQHSNRPDKKKENDDDEDDDDSDENLYRQPVVKFNVDSSHKKLETNTAAAFAKRSSTLQKATAKLQSDQSKNIPFDSMIELNAISSSTSSGSSNSPPKIIAESEYYTTADDIQTEDQNFKTQFQKDNPDQSLNDKQQDSEPKEKRRKKKKFITAKKQDPFSNMRYKVEFEKRNSPSSHINVDEEEDVTPEDVGSHVFGQVTYDFIPNTIDKSAETVQSNFTHTN